jgi:hypothetical protein
MPRIVEEEKRVLNQYTFAWGLFGTNFNFQVLIHFLFENKHTVRGGGFSFFLQPNK